MTDLHTHILPGMDDGPKDLETARALLELQLRRGIKQIALTSHYHPEMEHLDRFLTRREEAYGRLMSVCPPALTLRRGCEVYFSPELLLVDAGKLCLEGTNLLLLELPVLQKPAFLREVLSGLRDRGITVLIAHAERYLYVQKDPTLLARWKSMGCLIQISSGAVLSDPLSRKIVKWGLADVLASDTHSPRHRPPDLKEGLDAVKKTQGADTARMLERNAGLLFSGKEIPKRRYQVPKKVLGFWL